MYTNTVAKFKYDYNSRGLREGAHQSGEIFDPYHYDGDDDPHHGIYIDYIYDKRGQLTDAETYTATSSGGKGGTKISGRDYRYTYDESGNRTSHSVDGRSPNAWGVNDKNQVDDVHIDNVINVSGILDNDSYTPKVDGSNATKHYKFFQRFASTPSNDYQPVYDTASVQIYNGGTLVGSENVGEFLRENNPSPATYTYDLDGNILSDGKWSYTYDAENRVTQMVTMAGLPITGSRKRLIVFTCDYMGRVAGIIAYENDQPESDDRLYTYKSVYQGWNIIASLNGSSESLQRTYSWGLDMMSTLDSTGGVGALLAVTRSSNGDDFLPIYDGNGNIFGYVDGVSNSRIPAIFEYDPFGNIIREEYDEWSDEYSLADQLLSFSTKMRVKNTELFNYGFRYYDSRLGRFLNRDPIGEAGGINVYGFVGNDPINHYDYLGLDSGPNPMETGQISDFLSLLYILNVGHLNRLTELFPI